MARPRAPAAAAGACLAVAVLFAASAAGRTLPCPGPPPSLLCQLIGGRGPPARCGVAAAAEEYVRSWTVTDFSNLTLFEGSAVDFFPEYVEFAHEAGQTFAIWYARRLVPAGVAACSPDGSPHRGRPALPCPPGGRRRSSSAGSARRSPCSSCPTATIRARRSRAWSSTSRTTTACPAAAATAPAWATTTPSRRTLPSSLTASARTTTTRVRRPPAAARAR